ncbi:MAG: hypothetical protein ACI9KN_001886 [Gammaproteobacteria bacterium]|jgi:hypothetical protein
MDSNKTLSEKIPAIKQKAQFARGKNESKLILSIEYHNQTIQQVELTSGPSRQSQFLREEVARLEQELNDSK